MLLIHNLLFDFELNGIPVDPKKILTTERDSSNILSNICTTDNLYLISIYIVIQISKYNHVCSCSAKSVRTEKMFGIKPNKCCSLLGTIT